MSQWGNSLGVRIPKAVADKLGIKEGSEMNLSSDNHKITLEPIKNSYTLEELVSQITNENRHSSMDTGGPVGNELL
ncbi:AbrB/MazE/SpoVT family DNA-binding domain-containing protein [Sporosarcina sp. FA9]|uniref:AbrB/MazE/SpoVT family DNA-binding domain-containing protein n=1 Tax=Sporosarcina sp. FA9 TaxID=3413030 RepID=UPI003F655C7A